MKENTYWICQIHYKEIEQSMKLNSKYIFKMTAHEGDSYVYVKLYNKLNSNGVLNLYVS